MKGTMIKTANGMRRNKSCVVRRSYTVDDGCHHSNMFRMELLRTCLRSRRVRVSPWRIFLCRRAEMRTSLARS